MSWRYSASTYTPRDRSASRDSSSTKYGSSALSSTYSAADRPSRWSSSQSTREPSRPNAVEEHSPVWARTGLNTGSSSLVQRLKDKYSSNDASKPAPTVKRGETRDLTLPIARTYGRTATTNFSNTTTQDQKKDDASTMERAKVPTNSNEGEKTSSLFMPRGSFRKKSPEPEKTFSYEYKTRVPDYSPIESKPKIYTSSSLGSSPATSRYLSNKKGSGSSAGSTPNTPTTPSTDRNFILEKFERAYQQETQCDKTVLMVTRATSPSQPSASIYVRTRRADSARTIEKTVTRPKIMPVTANKECQVDESDLKHTITNKYSTYDTDRVKARPSYTSTISPYTGINRYSNRTSSYTPVTTTRPDFRRSVSKDRENELYARDNKDHTTTKAPPVSYTPITSRTDLRRSISCDRDSECYKDSSYRDTATSKGPPISYTPVAARYGVEYRRSLSRERDCNNKRSEDPPPIKAVTVKSSEIAVNLAKPTPPRVRSPSSQTESITAKPTQPVSTFSMRSPTPQTESSKATNTEQSSILKYSNTTATESVLPKPDTKSISIPAKSSNSSSKSTSSAAVKKVSSTGPGKMSVSAPSKEKSKSPTQSGVARERARSKTQESDTSISVSGFSDTSQSKSLENDTIPKSTDSRTNLSKKSASPLVSRADATAASDSESESESDETATTTTDSDTDDDVEEITKSSEPSSVKRSITNFLQNRSKGLLTTEVLGSKSRVNFLKTGSAAKIQFKHIESGERAWWMDSSGNVPEGVVKMVPSNKAIPDKNHLAPNFLVNRQFSREKDWLKNSSDDASDRSSTSPLPPRPPSAASHQQHTSPSPTHQPDHGVLLEVPKWPVPRQWSDEKPWWQQEDDRASPKSQEIVCDEHTALSTTCDSSIVSPVKSISGKFSPEASRDDEDGLDVTPALRRRREQQQAGIIEEPKVASYLNTESNEAQAPETIEAEKTFLNDCQLEFSVRDLTQKLTAVTNGVTTPVEEKLNLLEAGEMSGMIARAKAGLTNSTTKPAICQDDEAPQAVRDIAKSEIDIYWKELVDSLDRPLRLGDVDFTDLNSDDETDLFGSSRSNGGIPPPPPPGMMNGLVPPPAPIAVPGIRSVAPPPPPPIVKNKKTVKLFWKEVVDAKYCAEMDRSIWDELVPVAVDHNKLETLFESKAKDILTKKQQDQSIKTKAVVVLDNKRSNAINIGMTKLPPPRAIKAAILKMDSSVVTKEGIEKLLTMLPTEEEQARIQEAQAANPELPLGTAEQFLLTLASISELEARLRLWAFKMEFENSEKEICEPLQDLKLGMQVLKSNKTFQGILSTLLSIGNFLNGQDARGFQIEYLSKVPEVKDTVNKHSLIHHLCVFVMEKFPDSTDLYSEIGAVTRASKTDFDELNVTIKKLEDDCKCSWNHLKIIAKHEGQTAMKAKMSDFLADCAERIILIGIIHRRVMCRFRKFTAWLGVPINRITTTRPHELFKTISEFALEYRTTRERILQQMKRTNHHREKSRSRICIQAEHQTAPPKKLNSKEAKEDAKLRQLLVQGKETSEAINNTATWRRQRKQPVTKAELNGDDSEIIETLIKTAKQPTANRESLQERRRSRMLERKISQT